MPLVKYCFMKTCNNNSTICAGKLFFSVPRGNKGEWCAAAGLHNVPARRLFVCEDHLDLEEDMENYLYWKLMKVKPKLKKQVPVFKHQPFQEVSNNLPGTSLTTETVVTTTRNIGVMYCPEVVHKQVQVKPRMTEKSTSCALKIKSVPKAIYDVVHSSDSLSPSPLGSTMGTDFTEIDSSTDTITPGQKCSFVGRKFMLTLVAKNPMSYIGVPERGYWIIPYLAHTTHATILGLIVTLYKIKNNDTFSRIADLFEMSLTTIWRTFYQTLNILSKFLKQFIYWPSALEIKRNLPNAFQIKKEYAQVQAIIDCFEVELEKGSNPVEQSLTWSQYKSCNTAKYLISSTPNGFINYISVGYGGRASDMAIVEHCGFVESVPANSTVLSDRGFKHLETILNEKGAKLVRPPSVHANTKLTKQEVLQAKEIASLRVHIERVIRRVRMFKLLKPHSTVNNKLINTLNDVVIVACGLINLQSPIIKKSD